MLDDYDLIPFTREHNSACILAITRIRVYTPALGVYTVQYTMMYVWKTAGTDHVL